MQFAPEGPCSSNRKGHAVRPEYADFILRHFNVYSQQISYNIVKSVVLLNNYKLNIKTILKT